MRKSAKLVLLAASIAGLAGCETTEQREARYVREANEDIEAAAAWLRATMSPDERARFDQQVEANVRRDIAATASDCGTSVHISDAPDFVDSVVTIDRSASPEQVSCVQREVPFARADSTADPEGRNQ